MEKGRGDSGRREGERRGGGGVDKERRKRGEVETR